MIVRTLDEIVGSERDVCWGYGQSRRFLLKRDGMGFSLTNTVVPAGTKTLVQYENHVEACYCIQGDGEIEVNGEIFPIEKGTMYAPNEHEPHYVRGGKNDMHLICVFVPPLEGKEAHNVGDGSGSGY